MPPSGKRSDPYRNFHFLVEIDGVAQAAFQEVSGLAAEIEVIEYREGGNPTSGTGKLPGRVRYGNVTLRRGVTTGRELFDWWRTVAEGGSGFRRTVAIVLLDESRQPVRRWVLHSAWPAKYEVSPLLASGNEVAIESLELAHEGLELSD